MKKLLLLLVLLVTACAPVGSTLSLQKEPEYIKVPLQPARNAYANIRTMYVDIYVRASKMCTDKLMAADNCSLLSKFHIEVVQLDFEIRKELNNPKAELDMAKITKIVEIMVKISSMLPLAA